MLGERNLIDLLVFFVLTLHETKKLQESRLNDVSKVGLADSHESQYGSRRKGRNCADLINHSHFIIVTTRIVRGARKFPIDPIRILHRVHQVDIQRLRLLLCGRILIQKVHPEYMVEGRNVEYRPNDDEDHSV